MQYDVFICHASEDKDDFVRPLAEQLRQQHIHVWYDEFSLSIGDSLTQKIDEGLSRSRFGIVILSPNFFKKQWAKRELAGLNTREMVEGNSMILPVWHRVGVKEVMKYSPPLADKLAIDSAKGMNNVLREIVKKVKPQESPLVVARDHLETLGMDVPPISDEWWLNMVEYKELLRSPDDKKQYPWVFPLPSPREENGRERGMNIASAALQFDWSFDANELLICQLTPPERVHEYIRRWPGLVECARNNPDILALYAPQLTIPGFDSGFEDVFDELMKYHVRPSELVFSYERFETVDQKHPACLEEIALRHDELGNYTDAKLAHDYFRLTDGRYHRTEIMPLYGMVWLLSNSSAWLPDEYRRLFINGLKDRDEWAIGIDSQNAFNIALMTKTKKQFRYTKSILAGLEGLFEEIATLMDISQSPKEIVKRFIEENFVSAFLDYKEDYES